MSQCEGASMSSMIMLSLLVLFFAPAQALLVSKFQLTGVKVSSWQQLAKVATKYYIILNEKCLFLPFYSYSCRANRETCSYSAKRQMGFLAFAYDSNTQQCERAPPTCVRPAQDETAKEVFMSSVTSGFGSENAHSFCLIKLLTLPSYTSAEYLGCYLDSGVRNLPVSKGLNILDLTPDSCVFMCLQDGFPYSGVNAGKIFLIHLYYVSENS